MMLSHLPAELYVMHHLPLLHLRQCGGGNTTYPHARRSVFWISQKVAVSSLFRVLHMVEHVVNLFCLKPHNPFR